MLPIWDALRIGPACPRRISTNRCAKWGLGSIIEVDPQCAAPDAAGDCLFLHDRRAQHLLLARGSGIPDNSAFPDLSLEDLAPSITARLGVRLEDVDGRIVPWLAGG